MKIKKSRTSLVAAAILGLVAVGTAPVFADDTPPANSTAIPVQVSNLQTITDAKELAEAIRVQTCVVAADVTVAPAVPDATCVATDLFENSATIVDGKLNANFYLPTPADGVTVRYAVYLSNKPEREFGLPAASAEAVLVDVTAGMTFDVPLTYSLPTLGTATEGGKVGDGSSKVSVNFTLTNVPSKYTKANKLRELIKVNVYALPADATTAPATPEGLTLKKTYEENSKGSLLNGVYAGSVNIKVPTVESGLTVQNYAVYITLKRDREKGVASQTSVGQFVTATKDATSGIWTVTAGLDGLTLDFAANTGSIANPAIVKVDTAGVSGNWGVLITRTDSKGNIKTVGLVSIPAGATSVALPKGLEKGDYEAHLVQLNSKAGFSLDKAKNLVSEINLGYVAP